MNGLREVVNRFLREMDFARNTAATYRHGLTAFLAFVEKAYGAVDVTAVDEDCLAGFYRWMSSPRGRGYSPRTASVYLAAARRLLEWLEARGELPRDFSLTRALHRLRVHRGRRREGGYHRRPVDDRVPEIVTYYDDLPLPSPDSPEEVRRRLILLRARAVVHTLYATGARVSEIVALTREQVRDGEASEVYVVGKGNYRRILFFDADAQEAIRAYLHERTDRNPWLFVAHNGRRPGHITRSTVWTIVKEAVKALGLDRRTSPHTFRHYRATQMLNAGMPLESVQAFLGHRNIATTRAVYAETLVATLREQVRRFGVPAREAARSAGRKEREDGDGG